MGLFSRALIKSKLLLAGSLASLVLFNVFVIFRHLAWVTRFVFIGEALFAGISLASAFLTYFDVQNHTDNSGGRDETVTHGD